jgi:hypothetical protein
MMDELARLLGLGSPFVIAAATYGVFHSMDGIASPRANALVSNWIRVQPINAPAVIEHGRAAWILLFSFTFDWAFGSELFSWRRVARSWAISSIVVIVVTLMWGVIRPGQFFALFDRADHDLKTVFAGVVFSAYLFNLIPDYISAVQTQYFVRVARDNKLNVLQTVGILIADIACKTVIFMIFYCVAVMMLFGLLYTWFKDIREVWDALAFANLEAITWFLRYGPNLSVEKPGNPSIGIFYYSTFFPSVWLWLLIVSLGSFRALNWAVPAFFQTTSFAQWFIKRGDERPFEAIGLIAGAIVFVVTVLWQVMSDFAFQGKSQF